MTLTDVATISPEEEAAAKELAKNLNDPMWRLSNLYKIIIKGEEEDDDLILQFKPNRAQKRLLARLHHRNVILKARQLGFTTLIAILWLDTALFSKAPIRCAIVAQDKEAAETIFRDKVKFAYEQLPQSLRDARPLKRDSANELLFAHNGASIKVATSVRSGTIHRLHVSEFGKICAKYPDKAAEVISGSIPAVPASGILVIESTAEGQEGEFYNIVQRGKQIKERGGPLSPKDYRLHFFAWWEAPEYVLDPSYVLFTPADNTYFTTVEAKIGRELSPEQRAWWVATRDSDFSGDAAKMWQEYPSYIDEAFQVSTDGVYYSDQLSRALKEGRVLDRIPVVSVPVNTFWDLGRGDMTSIWFHQRATMQDRFLFYYENSGEELSHYATELQRLAVDHGYVWGTHYLPHDADYKRLGKDADTNKSIKEILEGLMPGQSFEIIPRISNLIAGIQATRAAFKGAWFDATNCKQGLKRLWNYRKRWNKTLGCWSEDAMHDENSHGADAFRTWGQAVESGITFAHGGTGKTFKRRKSSGMAV